MALNYWDIYREYKFNPVRSLAEMLAATAGKTVRDTAAYEAAGRSDRSIGCVLLFTDDTGLALVMDDSGFHGSDTTPVDPPEVEYFHLTRRTPEDAPSTG